MKPRPGPLVSIIVPAYNERDTLPGVIRRLAALPIRKEVIVVNDGSTDGGFDIHRWPAAHARVVHHPATLGKGAGIRTGLAHAKGEWTVVQDADEETRPEDIVRLLHAATRRGAVAAFGSRFLGGAGPAWQKRARHHPFLYLTRTANWIITAWTNLLHGTRYTDVACGYKLVPTRLLRKAKLVSSGFDIDAEIASKFAPLSDNIAEVKVHYAPRIFREGKKIRTWDTVRILLTIFRLRFRKSRL